VLPGIVVGAPRDDRGPGGLPKRPKGSDCKSAGVAFGGSNPSPATRMEAPVRGRILGRGLEARLGSRWCGPRACYDLLRRRHGVAVGLREQVAVQVAGDPHAGVAEPLALRRTPTASAPMLTTRSRAVVFGAFTTTSRRACTRCCRPSAWVHRTHDLDVRGRRQTHPGTSPGVNRSCSSPDHVTRGGDGCQVTA
jgi:hypothetical protein